MALTTGQTTVATSGTRVVLASSSAVNYNVVIKALAANTGTIYVGNSSVSSSVGFTLAAGESVTIATSNLANVWLDASANSQGVSWLAS